MKNWILALGALSVVSGCSPIVLEPLSGAQSADTPVVPGSTSSGGGSGGSLLLAMRAGDVDWQENNTLADGFGPPWTDPDSLVLFFSTDPQECSNPVLPQRCTGVGPFWQTVLAIPPELARPGLIDLGDPRIFEWAATTSVNGTAMCGGGGYSGPAGPGTLELLGNGTTSLSAKLTGGVQTINQVVIDGSYAAQVCGSLPAAAPPTTALAIRGVDLPPDSGVDMPAPDSLIVSVGTLPATCQDPWSAVDCTTATRLTFTLPLALQVPGVLDLADPMITAKTTAATSFESPTCSAPTSAALPGTVEILSIDATGLTFRIYQSTTSPAGLPRVYFDGLYSATTCP